MDYLMFIDSIARRTLQAPDVRFLVSGSDAVVRQRVLDSVIRKCREKGKPLVVISDSESIEPEALNIIRTCGYTPENGMGGEFFLFNPFQKISAVDGLSQIRQLLDILGYDEKQKGKLTSYLNLLRHLERLETGNTDFELTLEKIGEYCTTFAVEQKLQRLVDAGRIAEDQRLMYLAKYAECSSAGADFEDMFFLLIPFTREDGKKLGTNPAEALIFPTGVLDEDVPMRNLILKLLQFGLKAQPDEKLAVLVMDKGYGQRQELAKLVLALPANVEVHLVSGDVFTLCGEGELAMLMNRFPARVYSRHAAMSSAQAIERSCGEIEVRKTTYNVTYDRRWRSNGVWDVLMGNNKTENYGQLAPTPEPKFRKEMILQLAPGTGIVEYMGNSSVFVL